MKPTKTRHKTKKVFNQTKIIDIRTLRALRRSRVPPDPLHGRHEPPLDAGQGGLPHHLQSVQNDLDTFRLWNLDTARDLYVLRLCSVVSVAGVYYKTDIVCLGIIPMIVG